MPDLKEVTARSPKLDKETTVMVNFGETAEESIEMFGSDAVNSNAWGNAAVTIQAGIRAGHKAGLTDEQIQDKYNEWKLGVAIAKSTADPLMASLAKFKLMPPEEQAEYLEKLRDAAANA